ncbi:MAG: SDR family oxidoreductase [Fretibacterium sp.]|nr:SDR family oxidoreductase [Fretibacterium sp.]
MSRVIYDFTGERYVVTGASSGMGRRVALELAEAGAAVLALGRNEERLDILRAAYPELIVTASLDVCGAGAMERAIEAFVEARGRLNGGVHAAGISDMTPLRSYSRETARRIMDVSFWAGMDLLQLVTRSKFGVRGTSTVLFSSVYAASPTKGMFAYGAAKAAVNAALRSAAKEIGVKGHRVNSVLPGWVATPMTEQAGESRDIGEIVARHLLGPGKPEDVSGVVLFLLSGASRWMTGANIVVDGGYLA